MHSNNDQAPGSGTGQLHFALHILISIASYTDLPRFVHPSCAECGHFQNEASIRTTGGARSNRAIHSAGIANEFHGSTANATLPCIGILVTTHDHAAESLHHFAVKRVGTTGKESERGDGGQGPQVASHG